MARPEAERSLPVVDGDHRRARARELPDRGEPVHPAGVGDDGGRAGTAGDVAGDVVHRESLRRATRPDPVPPKAHTEGHEKDRFDTREARAAAVSARRRREGPEHRTSTATHRRRPGARGRLARPPGGRGPRRSRGEGRRPVEAGRALAATRPSIGAIAGAVGRVLAAGRTTEQLLEQSRALIERRDHAGRTITVLLRPMIEGIVMTHSASATVREARALRAAPAGHLHGLRPGRGRPAVLRGARRRGARGRSRRRRGRRARARDRRRARPRRGHRLPRRLAREQGRDDGTRRGRAGRRTCRSSSPARRSSSRRTSRPRRRSRPGTARAELEAIFEETPPELIDRYVTDEGVFEPDEIASLIDQTPFLREGYAMLQPERSAR